MEPEQMIKGTQHGACSLQSSWGNTQAHIQHVVHHMWLIVHAEQ